MSHNWKTFRIKDFVIVLSLLILSLACTDNGSSSQTVTDLSETEAVKNPGLRLPPAIWG